MVVRVGDWGLGKRARRMFSSNDNRFTTSLKVNWMRTFDILVSNVQVILSTNTLSHMIQEVIKVLLDHNTHLHIKKLTSAFPT